MDGLSVARSLDHINMTYPKVVRITITNTKDDPIYIKSEGFKFEYDIDPSPYGANNNHGIYEVKFDGRINPGVLTEFDFLLRKGDPPVSTWVPVSPHHQDQEILNAITLKRVGTLFIECQRISAKRNYKYSIHLSI